MKHKSINQSACIYRLSLWEYVWPWCLTLYTLCVVWFDGEAETTRVEVCMMDQCLRWGKRSFGRFQGRVLPNTVIFFMVFFLLNNCFEFTILVFGNYKRITSSGCSNHSFMTLPGIILSDRFLTFHVQTLAICEE